MKHYLYKTVLALLFQGCWFFASAQAIEYRNISFSEAMKEAKSTKQIVFMQMVSDCEQCNRVADKGLSGDELVEIYNKFVCIKVFPESDDYKAISKRFRISPNLPTSLFLNHNGHFLEMMYDRSTTRSDEYIKLAAMAMANRDNSPVARFEEEYASGNRSSGFLEEYISKLLELGLNTDDLLEEYVGNLTVDSLFSESKLKFVMKAAPVVDSRIYKLIRLDSKYHSLFMSLPLKERKEINRRVIHKSRKKAFREKNHRYMGKVARFIRDSYEDARTGQRAYENAMLDFYKEVKDTIIYIQTASFYYRREIEQLNIDSISKAEMESFIDMKDGRRLMGGRLLKVGNQINKMAWTIYEMTDDPEHLGRILKWAEKLLAYQNPAYHDTYAHILYKIGAREDAIKWQQKAVEISEAKGRPGDDLKTELNKMETGDL